ncbi:hypothetical protein V8F06_005253 [Rhypophila decipiens]
MATRWLCLISWPLFTTNKPFELTRRTEPEHVVTRTLALPAGVFGRHRNSVEDSHRLHQDTRTLNPVYVEQMESIQGSLFPLPSGPSHKMGHGREVKVLFFSPLRFLVSFYFVRGGTWFLVSTRMAASLLPQGM